MRITAETTLAELALERVQLGIKWLSINIDSGHGQSRLAIIISDVDPIVIGNGDTDAEAINDAFNQRRKQLAAKLVASEDPNAADRRTDRRD